MTTCLTCTKNAVRDGKLCSECMDDADIMHFYVFNKLDFQIYLCVGGKITRFQSSYVIDGKLNPGVHIAYRSTISDSFQIGRISTYQPDLDTCVVVKRIPRADSPHSKTSIEESVSPERIGCILLSCG